MRTGATNGVVRLGSLQKLREGLLTAIQTGTEPVALKGGRGLQIQLLGRPKRLIDTSGALTRAGEEYYRLLDQEPPRQGFDPKQVPRCAGNQLRIRAADGKDIPVRVWDNRRRRWSFTRHGREFYRDSVDSYV
jgi:hypothetical protein